MGIYEGNQEEDEKKIREQYEQMNIKKDTEEDSDGNLTDEDYDKNDALYKKINDLFYLDVN